VKRAVHTRRGQLLHIFQKKKMKKTIKIMLLILSVLLLIIILISSTSNKEENQNKGIKEELSTNQQKEWSYSDYSYRYVDEEVKSKLTKMIGQNGKTAFYLPPTGYINVSRGSSFGVAFALNNPNPSGENYFEYEFTSDSSTLENCQVTAEEVNKWITNKRSFGKVPKGWVDHMTVYFEFPENIPACNARFNFKITKDGSLYDTKQIEFNLL